VVEAGSALRGQRGLRPVPQVGAGLAVCVVCVAVGVGLGAVVVVLGFGFGGAVVVVTGCGPDVGFPAVAVFFVGFGPCVAWPVAFGFAVAVGSGGRVEGATVGFATFSGVGESVTLTWRLVRSSPPNVVGITLSGSAWNPMNASIAVATVASMTMTTLDSSDPRCAFGRVTAVTSPGGVVTASSSAATSTDCTRVVTLCSEL
jgi:hypothetical protein